MPLSHVWLLRSPPGNVTVQLSGVHGVGIEADPAAMYTDEITYIPCNPAQPWESSGSAGL